MHDDLIYVLLGSVVKLTVITQVQCIAESIIRWHITPTALPAYCTKWLLAFVNIICRTIVYHHDANGNGDHSIYFNPIRAVKEESFKLKTRLQKDGNLTKQLQLELDHAESVEEIKELVRPKAYTLAWLYYCHYHAYLYCILVMTANF